jgi:hypothetical protein
METRKAIMTLCSTPDSSRRTAEDAAMEGLCYQHCQLDVTVRFPDDCVILSVIDYRVLLAYDQEAKVWVPTGTPYDYSAVFPGNKPVGEEFADLFRAFIEDAAMEGDNTWRRDVQIDVTRVMTKGHDTQRFVLSYEGKHGWMTEVGWSGDDSGGSCGITASIPALTSEAEEEILSALINQAFHDVPMGILF